MKIQTNEKEYDVLVSEMESMKVMEMNLQEYADSIDMTFQPASRYADHKKAMNSADYKVKIRALKAGFVPEICVCTLEGKVTNIGGLGTIMRDKAGNCNVSKFMLCDYGVQNEHDANRLLLTLNAVNKGSALHNAYTALYRMHLGLNRVSSISLCDDEISSGKSQHARVLIIMNKAGVVFTKDIDGLEIFPSTKVISELSKLWNERTSNLTDFANYKADKNLIKELQTIYDDGIASRLLTSEERKALAKKKANEQERADNEALKEKERLEDIKSMMKFIVENMSQTDYKKLVKFRNEGTACVVKVV